MYKVTLIVLVVVTAAQLTSAWPGGAPVVACESLTPGHGVGAQTDEAPYHIMTSVIEEKRKFQIKLMGNTSTDFFKGFIVQARDPATNNPVGVFTVITSEAKTIKCANVDGNTATHKDNETKLEVTLVWTAPQTPLKEAAITYTVVKEKSTLWTNMNYTMKVNKGGLPAFRVSMSLCFTFAFLVLKLK